MRYGSLAGELVEADTEIHGDLADGYDQWVELFQRGLTEMRRRGDLHRTPIHATSQCHWLPLIRVAPWSPSSPTTLNHCAPR